MKWKKNPKAACNELIRSKVPCDLLRGCAVTPGTGREMHIISRGSALMGLGRPALRGAAVPGLGAGRAAGTAGLGRVLRAPVSSAAPQAGPGDRSWPCCPHRDRGEPRGAGPAATLCFYCWWGERRAGSGHPPPLPSKHHARMRPRRGHRGGCCGCAGDNPEGPSGSCQTHTWRRGPGAGDGHRALAISALTPSAGAIPGR